MPNQTHVQHKSPQKVYNTHEEQDDLHLPLSNIPLSKYSTKNHILYPNRGRLLCTPRTVFTSPLPEMFI